MSMIQGIMMVGRTGCDNEVDDSCVFIRNQLIGLPD